MNQQTQYFQYALWLAFFTIFYNAAEGLISIYIGIQDEALTLFGFGIDSLGTLGLIYYSYQKGKESFEKAAELED
ncbi:MAG: hypothetical protein JNK81_08795 [Anaerolineales bacterium]|nr:hypothetical protein [Anaerolineales bacterium]